MVMKRNIVAFASLLVVALPATAKTVTVNARADEVRMVRVSYADLNMSSNEGVERLMHRANGAARWVCDISTITQRPLAEELDGQRCYNASMARARFDINLIQQRAENRVAGVGAIEVAQR